MLTEPKGNEVRKRSVDEFTQSESDMWTLKFNGSKSKQGIRIGVELVNPIGKSCLVAYRLQFQCTDNIIEYEALIHGLLLAIKKGVKILKVMGDPELVVKQVRK